MTILNFRQQPSSAVTSDGWIWALPVEGRPSTPELTGKWLVFSSRQFVDQTWEIIRQSVVDGILSGLTVDAKVSTPNPDKANHVICVYTADYRDKAAVARCLSGLRRLGITWRLYYKTDSQTRAGFQSSTYCSDEFEGAQQLSLPLW